MLLLYTCAEDAQVTMQWLSHSQQGQPQTLQQECRWQDLYAMPAAAPSTHPTLHTWTVNAVITAPGNTSLSFGE
jgi:hypothetical protein